MDIESQNFISKILKFSELGVNPLDNNTTIEIGEIFETLKIDNPMHSLLTKNLSLCFVEGITKIQKNNSATKQKLKYKSKIDTDHMESVLNLSLWKNAPNTSNMFDAYDMKKNNLKNLSKNNCNINTYSNSSNFPNQKLNSANLDEEDQSVNKKFKNKFKYNNNYNKSENQDEESCEISEKFHQTNNYMSNQVNLKRKNNSNIEYENYSNSIYNINKKKNIKKNTGYNTFKKGKCEEEEEEEDEASNKAPEGFRSAITEVNKKVFNRNNNTGNNYNKQQGESNRAYSKPIENEVNNTNISNNTFKKFNPPVKAIEQKKSIEEDKNKDRSEKEKELDEKLKGFDKNV